ncbi:ATP-dependent DNA helicase RecG [Syntrophomonas palmitatica]|uniref:ATP-dependent DNA helicase RecG n=1 Tax=Syntrophomonas palmitatica TaxID=402877 RepID=UPI0009F86050|nr:ATP-dependent DNA helicase RecG [Syntrophomonas palmitatica]
MPQMDIGQGANMDRLFADIQYVKGVGPKRNILLRRLGIENILDLLWYVPRAYFNRGKSQQIANLKDGDNVNLRGMVRATHSWRARRGMAIFKAVIEDDSGFITAVWFNQPYISGLIKNDQEIFISGKAKGCPGAFEVHVSEFEILDHEDMEFTVLPIYGLTEGLNQKTMRRLLHYVLDEYLPYYPEIMEPQAKEKYGLCNIDYAIRNIHFPEDGPSYLAARKRLAFEELTVFQIGLHVNKTLNLSAGQYISHLEKNQLVENIRNKLPFKLTPAQQRAVTEIFADMEKPLPMNRLLQGDVGSGKTVVAALAMAKAAASGYQSAIMAPTEILAEQHYNSLQQIFAGTDVVIASLTGGTPTREKQMIVEAAGLGNIDILVGTHALIQEQVVFERLGLAVIDEQHRFGVKQRALFNSKGLSPDMLVMSATPIPRTLALTVHGELSLSIIDELPPGRRPVKTVHISAADRMRAYRFVRQETAKNIQAYIVCPLVEESEKQDLQAAVSLYDELKHEILPGINLGLLHGRMKSSEKDQVISSFKKGSIQVLVTTTVIEVGVDVPNASIMIIEHAERFGLSQLHQLRGRVGRGHKQSYCLMIGDPRTEEAAARLQAMQKLSDGFKLAQEDLRIRGPGDFWGVKQHGLHQLKVADLIKDQKIVESSRDLVENMMEPEQLLRWQSYAEYKFKKSSHIVQN